MAAIASHVKLHRLTAEDMKRLLEASEAEPAPAPAKSPTDKSDRQEARQEALTEYLETVRPLYQEATATMNDCRSCEVACQGFTYSNSIQTDANGNWYVTTSSTKNAETPACKMCSMQCNSRLANLTAGYNAARQRAISKGVYRHELDTGRLLFGSPED